MKAKIIFFVSGVATSVMMFHFLQSTPQPTEEAGNKMPVELYYHDTDNDGEEENILIYNCQGCNAPPRELAIIDDGELVFFYEGGNLEFIPMESGSFTISEANIPRDGRRIETEYL